MAWPRGHPKWMIVANWTEARWMRPWRSEAPTEVAATPGDDLFGFSGVVNFRELSP